MVNSDLGSEFALKRFVLNSYTKKYLALITSVSLLRIIDEKLMKLSLCNLKQSRAIPISKALNAIY